MIQIMRQSAGQIAEILTEDYGLPTLDGEYELMADYLGEQIERNSVGLPVLSLGVFVARKAIARHAERVAAVIERDKADRIAEADREAAILEISEGVYVNVGNAVVPPTPEWLTKGETMPFTVQADGEGHHVRSVKTVRRVITGHAKRAYRAGKITEEQKVACEWYRYQYDAAGLEGRVKTANLTQRISGGVAGGIMFTEDQVAAQWHFRNARARMDVRMLKFFDLVMIDEIPVDRACRVARSGRHPYDTLRKCADAITGYMDEVGIEK